MRGNKVAILALSGLAGVLVSAVCPQPSFADYYRTYTFTKTTTTPVFVTSSPVMVERVVEQPALIERVVEQPVMVERVVEKPVTIEKIVEKPVVIERRIETPVMIEKVDDHLINFDVHNLLHLGLF